MVFTKKIPARDNSIRTYKTRREASVKAAKESYQKAPMLFNHSPQSLPDDLRELHYSLEMLGKDHIYKEVQVEEDRFQDALELAKDVFHLPHEQAVKRARRDAMCEWIAELTVTFYEQIKLLYDFARNVHVKACRTGTKGFPPGFRYNLPRKQISHANEYVVEVSVFIEEQINDDDLFPETDLEPFPARFLPTIETCFKHMTRIYAILFGQCLAAFKKIQVTGALTLSFKQFYYAGATYGLLPKERDFEPLMVPELQRVLNFPQLRKQYEMDKKAYEAIVDSGPGGKLLARLPE